MIFNAIKKLILDITHFRNLKFFIIFKFFLGKIDYINVLDNPLPPSELQERTDSPIPSPSKSPSNGGDTPDG